MVGSGESDTPRVVMGFSVEVWMVGCLKGFWGLYRLKGIVWKALVCILECRDKGEGDLFSPNSPM